MATPYCSWVLRQGWRRPTKCPGEVKFLAPLSIVISRLGKDGDDALSIVGYHCLMRSWHFVFPFGDFEKVVKKRSFQVAYLNDEAKCAFSSFCDYLLTKLRAPDGVFLALLRSAGHWYPLPLEFCKGDYGTYSRS